MSAWNPDKVLNDWDDPDFDLDAESPPDPDDHSWGCQCPGCCALADLAARALARPDELMGPDSSREAA